MKKRKVDDYISVPTLVERGLDNKCWVCGKSIDNIYKSSRDHILPRAILKWCNSYFDSSTIEMMRKVLIVKEIF